MGNSQQQLNSNSYVHPRLGHVKRVQENHEHTYIIYEIVLQNQKLYDDWTLELNKINEFSEDTLFLPFQHAYNQTTYCGTGGLAVLKFDDDLYSLEPEIVNRREIKRPFNQQELLYLFYSLIKVEALLEVKGKTIGDVKPQNILVNEDGYVKIISQYSWPGEQNKMMGGWQKNNWRTFLSPEQCEERHKRKDTYLSNPQRNQSQVFSIGLTILEAGTLKDCSQIYGYTSEYRFVEVKLKQFLEIFQHRYSKELFFLVREMLHSNPRKRIKADIVYELLQPYEYQILNLEDIVIKFPSNENIPKDREEKISIKKLGESHLSHSNYQEAPSFDPSSLHPNNLRQSNYMKVSLGKNIGPSYQNRIPQNNFQPSPFSNSLQSGPFHPTRQSHPQQPQINFQLVNENSTFGRQISSMPPYQPMMRQNDERPIMTHSLPVNILPYEQISNGNRIQYITQNSMVENIGRPSQELNYISY